VPIIAKYVSTFGCVISDELSGFEKKPPIELLSVSLFDPRLEILRIKVTDSSFFFECGVFPAFIWINPILRRDENSLSRG